MNKAQNDYMSKDFSLDEGYTLTREDFEYFPCPMVGVNAIGESRGLCLIYQEPQLLVPDFEESNTCSSVLMLGSKSKFGSQGDCPSVR